MYAFHFHSDGVQNRYATTKREVKKNGKKSRRREYSMVAESISNCSNTYPMSEKFIWNHLIKLSSFIIFFRLINEWKEKEVCFHLNPNEYLLKTRNKKKIKNKILLWRTFNANKLIKFYFSKLNKMYLFV